MEIAGSSHTTPSTQEEFASLKCYFLSLPHIYSFPLSRASSITVFFFAGFSSALSTSHSARRRSLRSHSAGLEGALGACRT
eukprot:761439-Hanusia_phi.AAC.5